MASVDESVGPGSRAVLAPEDGVDGIGRPSGLFAQRACPRPSARSWRNGIGRPSGLFAQLTTRNQRRMSSGNRTVGRQGLRILRRCAAKRLGERLPGRRTHGAAAEPTASMPQGRPPIASRGSGPRVGGYRGGGGAAVRRSRHVVGLRRALPWDGLAWSPPGRRGRGATGGAAVVPERTSGRIAASPGAHHPTAEAGWSQGGDRFHADGHHVGVVVLMVANRGGVVPQQP